ncbi:unnamed protein product, partial [Rotaria sordida]
KQDEDLWFSSFERRDKIASNLAF